MTAGLRVLAAPDYELGPELAGDGSGRTWQAHDRRHDRPVVVKQPLTSEAVDVHRFLHEARLLATLQHPGIIPVYESGLLPDGRPFFAMRHVEGQRLVRVVLAATTFGERLALLPRLIGVADALAYAHARGVVHCDIRPENVLVGAHGETLIVNWGRAREVGACSGETRPADPRSDVYSLGTVLYFTLTGRSSQEGASPPPLASVEPSAPADLAAIVARATAPDPADRYAHAGTLAEDLKRFANGRLVRAHRYSLAALAGRWARRRLGAVVVAAAALLALASVGVVSFVRVAHQRDAAIAAQQRARTLSESGAQVTGFLIDRLYPRLQAAGRLQALVGLGAQVEAYYAALAQESIDAPTLSRRAGALAVLADVERDQGDQAQAERLYRASLSLMEQHRSRFGDEPSMRERRSQVERRLRPPQRP